MGTATYDFTGDVVLITTASPATSRTPCSGSRQDAARYVTGIALPVDGGFTCK